METLDLQTVIDSLPTYDDEHLYNAICDALSRILVKKSPLKASCEMGAHIYKVKMDLVVIEVRKVMPKDFFKSRALATNIKRNDRISVMEKARH